jgi:hypothetical protein
LVSYPEDGCHGCHGCHVSFPFRCFLHYHYIPDNHECQHLFEDFSLIFNQIFVKMR